ncbi:MAG: transposase [Nitrosopumilaceae archaeon]
MDEYNTKPVLAVKAVKQNHNCNEISKLMEEFHFMINEAIRIGLAKNITSKFTLRNELYPLFKNEFHTSYISMAVFKAHAILKNYRKSKKKNTDTKAPYVSKRFIVIDSGCHKILHDHFYFPTKPRQFIAIPLNNYTGKILSDPSLKLGNAILTANTLSISYYTNIELRKPSGHVGIDRNLDNITCVNNKGNIQQIDLSYATKIKEKYRRAKSHFRRNDNRIKAKLFQKYGTKQKNRVNQLLHKTSKQLVSTNQRIIMENLTGIRKLYRKGNGQGRNYRAKLNGWSYYELQRQIEYKSLFNGIPVIYVNPRGTSSKCSRCEAKILEENRMIRCPQCDLHVDRDVNAARNILARGMQFVPDGGISEAMVTVQRCPVDVPQLEVAV